MFSHTEFHIGVSIFQIMFLQYVWIKPHSSSLANEENLTSNFCQFFQICCGEKEREENNGNCKPFYVTRKCKNFKNVNELILMIDTFDIILLDDLKKVDTCISSQNVWVGTYEKGHTIQTRSHEVLRTGEVSTNIWKFWKSKFNIRTKVRFLQK